MGGDDDGDGDGYGDGDDKEEEPEEEEEPEKEVQRDILHVLVLLGKCHRKQRKSALAD